MKDGIKVQIMGDISRLPEHTQKVVIDALEKQKIMIIMYLISLLIMVANKR